MKRTSIVLFLIAASLVLLPTAKVSADCASGLDPGRCFEAKGYRVETVPLQGSFPTIDEKGNSVFTYKITKTTAKKNLKGASILIPVCTPALGAPTAYSCSFSRCSGTLSAGGAGDVSTGFGLGLTTTDTWSWNWKDKNEGTISFTFQGKVYASQNAMLLNGAMKKNEYPYGQILAPSCALISPPVAPPQVPLVVKREEQIGDVKVCTESSDQSGCPTLVYGCSDPAVAACSCPDELKEVWEQVPFSEIGVTRESLLQVWTDPDPRCPATYMITQGSTCVKKCYPSGYCYIGPKKCKKK